MKYYAVLPIRRDLIQDTGELFMLALVDEENLSRGLYLISQERQLHALELEKEQLELEKARLLAALEKLK